MKKLSIFICSIILLLPFSTHAASLHEVVSTEKLTSAKPVLAVDSDSTPHITFANYDKYKTTEFLVHTKRENGEWKNEIIDSKQKSNDWIPSFMLDSNVNTYFTYVDSKYYDITYSHTINGITNKEVLPTGDDFYIGLETRIAHDSDDWPYILYSDMATGYLRYAYQPFINTWKVETIGSMKIDAWSASLAFDAENNPHIVYFDNKLWGVQHVYKQDGIWKKETVSKPGEVDQVELRISSSGTLHILYHVRSNDGVWYASKESNTWVQESIGTGTSLSLMVRNNTPISSFLDNDRNELILLEKQSNNTWKKSTLVEGVGNVLSSSSILDQNGSPIVIYTTSTELHFLAPNGLTGAVDSPTPVATTTKTPTGIVHTATPQQTVNTPLPTQGTSTITTTPTTPTPTVVGGKFNEAAWVWQTQSDDPSGYFQAKPGDTVTVDVVFKNTGQNIWANTGTDAVSVALYKDPKVTSGPPRTCYSTPGSSCKWSGQFGSSYFYKSDWYSQYRISSLKESSVAPGESGTFKLSFAVPPNAPTGSYREDVSIAHGAEWMSNRTNGDPLGIAHIWVGITVTNPATTLVDFSKPSDKDLFTIIDTGDKDKPSIWVVQDGKFVQTSNIWGGTFDKPIEGKQFLGTLALLKEPVYQNFDVAVSMKNPDDDGMGLVFRHDGKNFYRLLLVKDPANGGPFVMLDKYVDGSYSSIATSTSWGFNQNEVYAVRVKAEGSHLSCWVDNTQIFDITNDSLTQGSIGLYSYGSKGLTFDDLLIETL